MAKKRAYQTYYRDNKGELRVQLVDAETGKPVTDKSQYITVDSTDAQGEELIGVPQSDATENSAPQGKSSFKEYSSNYFRGQHGNSPKSSLGVNGESNNFGFISKPSWSKYASFVPGPIGKIAAVGNAVVNGINVNAVNEARKHLGLEPMSTKDIVKGVVTGVDEGQVGDVKIGKKSYGVSLNEAVIDNKTQLTVPEARVRSDIKAMQDKVYEHLTKNGFQAKSKIHPELDPNSTANTPSASNSTPDITPDNGYASRTYSSVLGGGAGWTKVQLDDGTTATVKGDRAVRNNNPGNMEYGPYAKSMGAIGTDGRFAVFSTREDGVKAQAGWYTKEARKHPEMTLGQAISKYAPSFENNTKAYTNALAKAGNITPDTKLTDITPEQMNSIISAQHAVEGNTKARVYDDQGVQLGIIGRTKTPQSFTPSVAPATVGTMDEGLADQGLKPGDVSYDSFKQLDSTMSPKTSFGKYSAGFYSAIQKQPDAQSVANTARKDSANRPGIAQMDNPMSPTAGMNTAAPGSTSSANFGRTDSPSSGKPSSNSFGPGNGATSTGSGFGKGPGAGMSSPGFGGGHSAPGMGSSPGSRASPSSSAGKSFGNSPSEGASHFGGTGLGSTASKDKDKDKSQGPSGGGYGGWGGPH